MNYNHFPPSLKQLACLVQFERLLCERKICVLIFRKFPRLKTLKECRKAVKSSQLARIAVFNHSSFNPLYFIFGSSRCHALDRRAKQSCRNHCKKVIQIYPCIFSCFEIHYLWSRSKSISNCDKKLTNYYLIDFVLTMISAIFFSQIKLNRDPK